MVSVTFDSVANLAAQLPPEDQKRLADQIESRLNGAGERGSPAAVLAAMRSFPRLTAEEAKVMEEAIGDCRSLGEDGGLFDENGDK